MDRYLHRLIDIYIKRYVRNNPGQLKRLDELASIQPESFLVISSTALGDTDPFDPRNQESQTIVP